MKSNDCLKEPKIVVVAGPTAVGKTAFAIEIARAFNGEIVSCDSMQLYKFMDIGSAKPTEKEMTLAPHHLVDFVDPRENFSVAQYSILAKNAIEDILSREKLPIISGGTGLYLNSILYNMDFADGSFNSEYRRKLESLASEKGSTFLHDMLKNADAAAADRIHPNNTKKIIRALERIHEGEEKVRAFADIDSENNDYKPVLIGLTRDREELYDRINRRVDILVDEGLVDEVKRLTSRGLKSDDISMKGIGYKEIIDYLDGKCSLDTAIDTVKKNTRHYAKRQLTWFRRYDKMNWYNLSEYLSDKEALEDIKSWLKTSL